MFPRDVLRERKNEREREKLESYSNNQYHWSWLPSIYIHINKQYICLAWVFFLLYVRRINAYVLYVRAFLTFDLDMRFLRAYKILVSVCMRVKIFPWPCEVNFTICCIYSFYIEKPKKLNILFIIEAEKKTTISHLESLIQ